MKRISIVPRWSFWRGNRMFDGPDTNLQYVAYRLWREQAAREGFAIDTDDICSPSSADLVWMIDLPHKRRIFDELTHSLRSSTKLVLQVLESPLIAPTSFNPRNQERCDFVLSYEKMEPSDPPKYYYRLPHSLDQEIGDMPFSERRCSVMINSNRMEGWRASSRVGTRVFPGWGKYLTGWNMPLAHLVNPASGELYSWRRKLARTAERFDPNVLDIYGSGWRGESITWLPAPRPKPYRCGMQTLERNGTGWVTYLEKCALISQYKFGIAAENYRGTKGYVSEKILDVMCGGAVPVYLGDEGIGNEIPGGAFVDARNFTSQAMLWRYLASCSETEWQQMRDAGRLFLSSEKARAYSHEAFVATAMEILRKI